MTESEKMLEKQAEWQRSRSSFSWKQKLEFSVVMRNSLKGFVCPKSEQIDRPRKFNRNDLTCLGQ